MHMHDTEAEFCSIFQTFNIFPQKPTEIDITQKEQPLNKYIVTKRYLLLQDCKTYAWQFKLKHKLYNSSERKKKKKGK